MRSDRGTATERLAQQLLETFGSPPLRELLPMRPPPLATPEHLASAQCAPSPTGAHRWDVDTTTEQRGVCRDCAEERVFGRDASGDFTSRGVYKGGKNLGPESRAMREAIVEIAVGEQVVIPHHHLTCVLSKYGGMRKCGVLNTLKDMQRPYGMTKWKILGHEAPWLAIVTRVH